MSTALPPLLPTAATNRILEHINYFLVKNSIRAYFHAFFATSAIFGLLENDMLVP
jgi:hypothetical protein